MKLTKTSWLTPKEVQKIIQFAARLGYDLNRLSGEGCYAAKIVAELQADMTEADVVEFINRVLSSRYLPFPGTTMAEYLNPSL